MPHDDLVLILGSTMRLTRLVVADQAGGPLVRDPIHFWMSRSDTGIRHIDTVEEGLNCPFCVGFWIGSGVMLSYAATRNTRFRGLWRFATATLTLNEVAGHLALRLGDTGDDNEF